MKNYILTIVIAISALFSFNAHSQEWLWARATSSESMSFGSALTTATDGSVYTGGSFIATTFNIGGQSITKPNTNRNLYLMKHDANGILQWLKGVSTVSNLSDISGVDTDDAGNIYAVGRYEGTLQISGQTLTSNGAINSFIAKFSSDGNLIWLKSLGASNYTFISDIKIVAGYMYIAGSYDGDYIAIGSLSFISNGAADAFIAKYDLDGNVQLAQSFGGFTDDFATGIDLDSNGNMYVSGTFMSPSISLNNTITNQGQRDAYLAKFSPDATNIWIKSSGGSSDDDGGEIVIDNSDNIYVASSYNGTYTAGTYTFTAPGTDFLILKYNSAGNIVWAERGTGNSTNYATSIKNDDNGNIFVTGFSTSGFISLAGNTTELFGQYNIFVSKLNNGGNHIFTITAGGPGEAQAEAMTLDGSNNIIISGKSQGITLGSTTLSSGWSMFVAKYGQDTMGTQTFKSGGGLYPNPTSDILNIQGEHGSAYTVSDISGRTVSTGKIANNMINVAELPSGIYILNSGGSSTRFIKK